MRINEFGKENQKTLLLVHPSAVRWDYFSQVIPLLESDFHLFVPVLPGYDPDEKSDFTSIEDIAERLSGITDHFDCIYGCSMGGSVCIRMLAERKVPVYHAVIDGGITPYQLPWLITRLIAVRDYLIVSAGKYGGAKLLEKAFSADEYSEEACEYIADVMKHMSSRTIWNTFDSCNNYKMEDRVFDDIPVQYWFGEGEENDRAWDIAYMKKHFMNTQFIRTDGLGHAGMASLKPELFAERIRSFTMEDNR